MGVHKTLHLIWTIEGSVVLIVLVLQGLLELIYLSSDFLTAKKMKRNYVKN